MPIWLGQFVSWLTAPEFTALANVVGVAGFALTLFVFFSVRQIANHYSSLVRLPELRNALTSKASILGNALGDFANQRDQISLELAKTLPHLASVRVRLKLTQRGTVKSLIKAVRGCQSNPAFSDHQVRIVFNQLHMLIGELEQWENDSKWSK